MWGHDENSASFDPPLFVSDDLPLVLRYIHHNVFGVFEQFLARLCVIVGYTRHVDPCYPILDSPLSCSFCRGLVRQANGHIKGELVPTEVSHNFSIDVEERPRKASVEPCS